MALQPGQRQTMTPEGAAFADDSRLFKEAGARRASHRRREPQKSDLVRFRVLAGQGLADYFVRPKLGRFFAANPMIEFDFVTRPPSNRLAYDLEDSDFDFALVHRRADRAVDPYMRHLTMVRGGIYGHGKFAEGKELPLSVEELNALPFILPLAGSAQERDVLSTLDRYGIRPRDIIGHTQYYDVMAAMLDRGLGVSSFSEAILKPAMRATVVQLYPLEDWRLLWYRRDRGGDPRCEAVESFLLSAVLQDPAYPTLSVIDEHRQTQAI